MARTAPTGAQARDLLERRHRWRLTEALPWVLAVVAFFAFPKSVFVGTQVLILILFALSLDLILGYAGIVTLGHAAFFGMGAYAAGGLSAHAGWHEPITGLLFAGACSGLLGLAAGYLLMRYTGLALIMLTLALGSMMGEAANAMAWFTGGFDGLMGIRPAPLFGVFENDLLGHTYYWYTLVVLFLALLVCRRIVNSPFGLSLRGIRENSERMPGLGCDLLWRKLTVFAISAAIAGLAGGLFAQSNAFVTLEVFSFARSGTVLIVLILGGTGRLYGAFLGGALYYLLEHELAALSPEFWQFGVGLVLLAVIWFERDGLLGLLARAQRRLGRSA